MGGSWSPALSLKKKKKKLPLFHALYFSGHPRISLPLVRYIYFKKIKSEEDNAEPHYWNQVWAETRRKRREGEESKSHSEEEEEEED